MIPGSNTKPADVFVPGYTAGRGTAYDVTVINPLQSATVAQAAITPGHALNVAYNRKMNGAAEICHNEGHTFIPLVMESLGGLHDQAIKEIKKLGASMARQIGEDEGQTVNQQFQRISVLLMKGSSALIINRQPQILNPALDGQE